MQAPHVVIEQTVREACADGSEARRTELVNRGRRAGLIAEGR